MNSTEYIRLIAFLKRFDCNNREAATYIECLQSGSTSVQEIAKKLNSNRVTVHSTIEQLIKKGLLFETRKNKKRLIIAESPDVLYRILQRKANELKLIENDLDTMTRLLNSIQSQDQNAWKVRVYEGMDDFQKVLEEMAESRNDIYVFSYREPTTDIMNIAYLGDYYKRLAQNGIHSRIICPPGDYANSFKALQTPYQIQIRLLPKTTQCEAGFYSWEDNIALQSFKDNQIICNIIQNKDLSIFFRNVLFDFFWKVAHPVK